MASVSGTVFGDANSNGVRDAGEGGQPNVTVYADKNYDGFMQASELRAVTDFNGFYRITGIVADNTSTGIRISSLSGVSSAQITAPAGGGHSARFGSDYEATNRDFGVAPAPTAIGTVAGRVVIDADKDGVADASETGVANVRVYVDANGNGVYDGEQSVLTNGSGGYALSLPATAAGTNYSIRATLAGSGLDPAGYEQTGPTANGGARPVLLKSGTTLNDVSFAFAPKPTAGPSATVSGTVYNDSDRDGAFDAGEVGVAGVSVYADLNYNGTREANEPIATTNAGGVYSLPGIPLSNTSIAIRALAPSGRTFTNPSGGALSGRFGAAITYAGRNFGLAPSTTTPATGAIVFQPFYDRDGDGVRDAGEAATGGTVWLDLDGSLQRESGEPLLTESSPGVYVVSGVAPGAYKIAFRSAGDFNEYADAYTDVTVVAGSTATRVAALTDVARVEVIPFYDLNNSGGPEEGDTSSRAFDIWLDTNGNGLHDPREVTVYSTGEFDGAGLSIYRTETIAAGTYAVALRRPGDVDLYADYTRTFSTRGGYPYFLVPTTSSLGGIVYNDLDGDGFKDGAEAGTGGVTVFADYDFDGSRDANEPQTTTVSDGSYKLYGIRSDNVAFRVTALVPGATFTQPAAGYYQARFDRAYDLASQGGRDFGYRAAVASASVSGVVFNDADRDGVRDAGDDAVQGVTVYADRDYDGVRDAGEPTAVTDSLGRYTLSIPTGPNSVAIRLERIAASRITAPAGGAYSGKYTLPYRVENANFGLAAATVTGRVFRDADRDGVQDAGEGAAAGAMVFADYDGDGTRDADEPSTSTAADGSFALAARGGRFTVRVDPLEFDYENRSGNYGRTGFLQTTAAGAAAAQVDTATTSTLANRTLGAIGARFDGVRPRLKVVGNETDDDVRAELALGNGPHHVWRDLDRDGVRDAGEPGALYDSLAVREDRHLVAHLFLVADGESYRFSVGASDAVGTRALGYRDGVGGAAAAPFVDVPPVNTAVFGRLFYDANGNGARDAGEGYESGFGYLAPRTSVFADYDRDGVRDADEPSAEVYAGTEFYDSFLSNGAYYVLNVDPSRSFAVRAVVDDGRGGVDYPQTVAPILSVAANTYSGRHDVGVTWTGG